jgi:hypothetical protein
LTTVTYPIARGDRPIDVFVSYAHANDDVPFGADQGWVTTLVGELKKILHRTMGGEGARIWMDHHLAASDHVDEVLVNSVRSSRTLLLVMSPAYQRSAWCRRELGNYIASSVASGALDAVFIVETEPVDRDRWHPVIRSLKSIRFWDRAFHDRAPRLLGYPVPKLDEHSPYWLGVNELAHLIADRLQGSAAVGAPAVWIAEPTDDLLEDRDRMAAMLRQHGFDPLPSAPYPRQSEDTFDSAVRNDVERAIALVQLFGPRPGSRPTWSAVPDSVRQARLARTASSVRDVPYFRWRPRDVVLGRIRDAAYRELLTGIETSNIEEFKLRIVRALIERRDAVVADDRRSSHIESASAPFILVNADSVDRDLAHRVQDSLVRMGADVALSPEPTPEQSPQDLRLAHEAQLNTCHGVVLVYGRTRAAWVQSQFAFSRKVLARRRRGVWGVLLDGPPDQKPDVGLRSPNLLLLNCRAGFDPVALAGFVSTLEV